MTQSCDQEVTKLAERMGADRVLLVVADQNAQVRLVLMHVEMVEPEPGHALTQLVRRIERLQHRARLRLPHPLVHRLLIDLLRGLLLVGVGDLVGALGLCIERRHDVAKRLVHIPHCLDLRLRRLRQCKTGRRMELLVEPALGAQGLQMRRARGVDAEGEAIEKDHVMRRQIGRIRRPRRHQDAARKNADQATAELA
jgi:hypothetical protein